MVDVEVTVTVPGATHTYTPSLADTEPTPVKVTSSRATGLVNVLLILAVILIAVPRAAVAAPARRPAPVRGPSARAPAAAPGAQS